MSAGYSEKPVDPKTARADLLSMQLFDMWAPSGTIWVVTRVLSGWLYHDVNQGERVWVFVPEKS